MSEECEHDWRVNPFVIPTWAISPGVTLFCVKCSKETTAPFHFRPKVSNKNDPRTWKKYTGDTTNL